MPDSADPTLTSLLPDAATLFRCWSGAEPARDQLNPSTDAQSAAPGPSAPTASRPGPPTVTLAIKWLPPPERSSVPAAEARVHVRPSTDVHAAAKVTSYSGERPPTPTKPGPPTVTLDIHVSPPSETRSSKRGTRPTRGVSGKSVYNPFPDTPLEPSTEVHAAARPPCDPTATRPGPPTVTLAMGDPSVNTASSSATRDQSSPSTDVHRAARPRCSSSSTPTATRPGPPTVTLAMDDPSVNTASSCATRDQASPSTDVQTAALSSNTPKPRVDSDPTATIPGPPAGHALHSPTLACEWAEGRRVVFDTRPGSAVGRHPDCRIAVVDSYRHDAGACTRHTQHRLSTGHAQDPLIAGHARPVDSIDRRPYPGARHVRSDCDEPGSCCRHIADRASARCGDSRHGPGDAIRGTPRSQSGKLGVEPDGHQAWPPPAVTLVIQCPSKTASS